MESYPKYRYPAPVKIENRQWPDRVITKSPTWASVDLRDGNQALPEPMSPEHKLEYFNMLVKIGFKEIEVAFPSASADDYNFVRMLIEQNLIPEDVTISVLTQARKHLVDKTAESLRGARRAIIHCYVPTSDLHGRFVFNHSREQVREMAIEGTRLVREAIEREGLKEVCGYEFSPEEFTDSDLDFVLDLCCAVKREWGPSTPETFILNLPATVERRPPNQYADMIELFCRKYPYLAETAISIHAHNDQGCAVAASELAILAGATRVEGTIFGHGERTGNLDLSVLALNLESRGVSTGLSFGNMPEIVRIVERNSGIEVHPRHPYAGDLAFTAFSGSHQDAIRKGFERRTEISEFFSQGWKIPYLHVDPADLGRQYEKLIRINSQSGKGGVVYVLEKEFGIYPPKSMHPEIGTVIQKYIDETGGEIDSKVLRRIFNDAFVNIQGKYRMENYQRASVGDRSGATFTWHIDGKQYELTGQGNGPLSAVVHSLKSSGLMPFFKLEDFSERSLGKDADAHAIAFVGLRCGVDGEHLIYGAGEHSNIDRAAIAALVSAMNRAAAAGAFRKNDGECENE
ncbi:MAG: 2-isopropylmalate synthase [Lentisphaeria bacterium]|nr:2-isopropylmalate synthase [Lentisphaeria bacterium]